MKIVVIGATGLIGTQLVAVLQRAGHAVVAGSRANGIDAVSGTGIVRAVAGADVVVDVMNVPERDGDEARRLFVDASTTLLRAEADAGVGHHIVLSVVGVDRAHGDGYFRAKAAQEEAVESGGVPYTIVRATQFYEFAHQIAAWNTVEDTVRLPGRAMRPVASGDVTAALVRVAGAAPVEAAVEVAGPEVIPLDDFVRRVLLKDHDERYVFTAADAQPIGFNLDGELLLPGPDASISPTTLESWLHRDHVDVTVA
ncbi:SDR family oxidoreductase [Herbiconiux sp. CPCC 205763]|uniref:SDR family oxidoreductase n=1 Tax=Herbiconiux aconitum TaxID=2970913 RepID=A0ABT2GJY7_9MICO|nr:SDR family oxidoreductase [Herbiconiux aconitum]MCS5716532.1 SDR family oxidoreductase [Herbiconiux aconitum]